MEEDPRKVNMMDGESEARGASRAFRKSSQRKLRNNESDFEAVPSTSSKILFKKNIYFQSK